MPDHDTPDNIEESRPAEAAVLGLLLDQTNQRPWAVEELIREIGRPLDVTDAIGDLHAAGLVHRFGDFVFVTRAAVRFDQMEL